MEKVLSDLDKRSNQPQHSFKPKPNTEQGPYSLQFYKDGRDEEATEEKYEASRG